MTKSCRLYITRFNRSLGVVVLTSLLSLVSPKSLSQQEFFIGGYAGFNASQFSGDGLAGFNKFGAYLGIYTGQELTDKWQWELGMIFSQKGSFKNYPGFRYLLSVGYIEVPVAFRYFWKYAHFEFGPAFGTRVTFRELQLSGAVNDTRKFNRFEISGFVGVMYDVNERISLVARMSNSLVPVRKHKSGETHLWNLGQYHSVITGAVRLKM